MKIKTLISAAALAAVMYAPVAAYADTASATASATVRQALTIAKNADLNFGTFSPSALSGSVSIASADGNRTGSNVELLSGGTTSAASFALDGENSASVSVSVSSLTQLTSGSDTMNITLQPQSVTALDGSGDATLNIGADLTVGANQAAGTYTGSFNVTVAYN